MARRSLQASPQGIQIIKKALRKKKGGQTYVAGAVGCSRQTIWSLLQGNPTDCDFFIGVCKELKLNWEEMAEPELPEPEQNDSQDIDALVQEVRSRAHADTQYIERTGTMRMLRVNHPVPVTDIYVDLNILKRVSSDFSFSAWGKESEFDWRSFDRLGLGQVEQERVPAIEKIRDYRKLMVLGKPGAGKSTLLKSIASKCIKPNDNQPDERWLQDYIPVFITLERFARKSAEEEKFSIRDAIQRQFDHWGMAEAAEPILKQGRLLILMDGLDQVPTPHSESVIWKIRYFCEEDYAANRFIITCRTQSLKSRFEGFTEVEIADFTPKQVKRFIKNWFAVVVGNAEAAELAERLIGQLQQNKPVAELAVTPILLNLTCSVFWDDKPVSSRAFYVDLTRSHKHSFALTQSLVFKRDPMCAEALAFIENPHHTVVLFIYRAKLGDALTLSQINHYQGSPLLWDFALIRALRAALQIDCNPKSQLSFVQANTRTLIYSLEIEHKLEPELQLELQKRKNQLSEISNKNQESLLLWWQENGQVWIEQLRKVMINYRNIGHDWQFSDVEIELLRQYYYTNKLLVDCLNLPDICLSRDVKQETEETLLLPIEEIKKRRNRRDDEVIQECNKNDEKT